MKKTFEQSLWSNVRDVRARLVVPLLPQEHLQGTGGQAQRYHFSDDINVHGWANSWKIKLPHTVHYLVLIFNLFLQKYHWCFFPTSHNSVWNREVHHCLPLEIFSPLVLHGKPSASRILFPTSVVNSYWITIGQLSVFVVSVVFTALYQFYCPSTPDSFSVLHKQTPPTHKTLFIHLTDRHPFTLHLNTNINT